MRVPDRWKLLGDADYFATELVHRLEALQKCEPVAPTRTTWQQSAALVRRVRRELRQAKERDRLRRLREQRLQDSRR